MRNCEGRVVRAWINDIAAVLLWVAILGACLRCLAAV
jgi:hypothetical protein